MLTKFEEKGKPKATPYFPENQTPKKYGNFTVTLGSVLYTDIPAVTYLSSSFAISRRLYRNSEFRDMYLKTLAYHMKNTFNPTRMNKIVDELANEIKSEMPYHIQRWNSMYPSMTTWENNVDNFKRKLSNRYYNVLGRNRSDFNLSYSEYNKYFGDIK